MKTITITITVDDLSLKNWLSNPWKVRPTKWGKRHMRKAALEISAHETSYIPQIKYLRTKAKENGFHSDTGFGLKEAKETVDRMMELGFLRDVRLRK